MKAKWYLSALLLILTLLVVNQQQLTVPNQEIVIQFDRDELSLIETQNTISIVKEQLQQVGVNNIKVQEGENGELKISYFSELDVALIKKIFSEEKELKLGFASILNKEPSNFPKDKNSNNYKLDVFEILKSNDIEGDFNGLALELNSENDRFFKPNVYFSINKIAIWDKNKFEKVAYTIHRNIANAIDNSSHTIPEVRAGPVLI